MNQFSRILQNIVPTDTDRALPPSITFSAMMTPMMTDFKKFCFGHLRAAD
jgi:hypothetical protein